MLEQQQKFSMANGDVGDFRESQNQFQQPGFQLDPPQFDPMGIVDPGQFEYSNQVMPSMESPNFNMDYTQVCS